MTKAATPSPNLPRLDQGYLELKIFTLNMSLIMLSSFSGILVTCMLLLGLTQGQQAPDPPSARLSCPEGFASRGSHCYGLLTFEETWNTAELLCQEYPSGHLLSLLNDGETSFVAALIAQSGAGSKPFWIGLHDTSQTGKWKWSSNALYLYQAWEEKYPSNSQPGYCAILSPESGFEKWRNVLCSDKLPYICKFKV